VPASAHSTLLGEGFGFAAICSNDAKSYPEDSFANMQRFAKSHRFPFPYLHDEGQAAAGAYGAVPDLFGYDAARKLKYRGRLDEGRTNAPSPGARRELVEAMRAIAATGTAPSPQFASMGCSIKLEGGLNRLSRGGSYFERGHTQLARPGAGAADEADCRNNAGWRDQLLLPTMINERLRTR
jgi:AhpC/TSA family